MENFGVCSQWIGENLLEFFIIIVAAPYFCGLYQKDRPIYSNLLDIGTGPTCENRVKGIGKKVRLNSPL